MFGIDGVYAHMVVVDRHLVHRRLSVSRRAYISKEQRLSSGAGALVPGGGREVVVCNNEVMRMLDLLFCDFKVWREGRQRVIYARHPLAAIVSSLNFRNGPLGRRVWTTGCLDGSRMIMSGK